MEVVESLLEHHAQVSEQLLAKGLRGDETADGHVGKDTDRRRIGGCLLLHKLSNGEKTPHTTLS